MAEIFNEQPGAGFNPTPRTDEQNAALINAIKAQSGAFGKNKSNFGLTAGLRSAFDLEGPESLGIMAQIPSLVNSFGDRSAFPRSSAIKALNLDPETERMYLEKTEGSESLTVPSMFENMSFGPEGNFLGGLELGGGNLTSPSGIEFERVSGGNDNLETIMAELEAARREVKDSGVLPRFDQEVIEGSGEGLSTGNIEKVLEAEAAEIDALLGNNPVFDNPMGDIESLIEQAKSAEQSLKEEERLSIDPPKAPTIASMAEDDRTGAAAQEQNQIDQAEERKAYLSNLSSGEKDKVIEDSFAAAMSDYNEAAGKAPPKEKESKEDSLARYKKEFEEATGIDASGKVDKSRALMAFGLALMKNKGGNLFEELGIAGEKAMPYIDKARSDARAAQLASGNYALGQQKADVAADRAALQATAGFKSDMYLKWYDSQLKREENRLKSLADLKQAKIEGGGSDYTKTKDFTFASGAGDATAWKIPVVYDTKTPSGGVILKPDAFARKYIDGRAGVEDALDVIGQMRQASTEIAAGGGTSKFAFDKINSIAKAVFPNLNTGQPSSEQEYAQGVNLLMGRFKRFLTQETGNGISNIDVQIWTKEIMKKPSWFTNADETASALGQLEDIFYAKITEFDQGLEFIYNTDNLLPGDFERMTKTYGTLDQIQGSTGNLILKDGKIVRSK